MTDVGPRPAAAARPRPAGAPRRPSRRALGWLPWIGLVVVVAVALAIGSQRHSHPTLTQRTYSIANAVRCPLCVGETAAQSDIPASVEIRAVIRQELQAGESRSQILAGLVSSYGPGILERPPVQGINVLLWVLPAVAVVLAVAGLVLAFLRWRPGRIGAVSDDDRRLVDGLLQPPSPGGPSGAAP
jgi:cytochrome c-type biogenesis protein CcmH